LREDPLEGVCVFLMLASLQDFSPLLGLQCLSVPCMGLRAGLRPELGSLPDVVGGGGLAVEKQLPSCPDTA